LVFTAHGYKLPALADNSWIHIFCWGNASGTFMVLHIVQIHFKFDDVFS
jgi:hypothetical protein